MQMWEERTSLHLWWLRILLSNLYISMKFYNSKFKAWHPHNKHSCNVLILLFFLWQGLKLNCTAGHFHWPLQCLTIEVLNRLVREHNTLYWIDYEPVHHGTPSVFILFIDINVVLCCSFNQKLGEIYSLFSDCLHEYSDPVCAALNSDTRGHQVF